MDGLLKVYIALISLISSMPTIKRFVQQNDLHDKYAVETPTITNLQKISVARDKLIEEIAISLGYKDKLTWETIQNPYIPTGMSAHLQQKETSENNMAGVLELFSQMLLNNQQHKNPQEDISTESNS